MAGKNKTVVTKYSSKSTKSQWPYGSCIATLLITVKVMLAGICQAEAESKCEQCAYCWNLQT
jgi:hypothetical protein